MTRKRFLSLLTSVPLCGVIATRLSASEPVVKVNVAPTPEPACVPVDFTALLWAIGEVEGGSDDKPSVRGERSAYQITYAVWRQHEPRLPFTQCKGGKAWMVAMNHLHWLDRHIPRVSMGQRYEREWAIAYAWNAGLEGYRKAHSNRSGMSFPAGPWLRSCNYANRVQALYLSRHFIFAKNA